MRSLPRGFSIACPFHSILLICIILYKKTINLPNNPNLLKPVTVRVPKCKKTKRTIRIEKRAAENTKLGN